MNKKDIRAIQNEVARIKREKAIKERVRNDVDSVQQRTRVDGYFY